MDKESDSKVNPLEIALVNNNSQLVKESQQLLQLKVWGIMVFGKEFILEIDFKTNTSIYITKLKKVEKRLLIALCQSIRDLLGTKWNVVVRNEKRILIESGEILNNVTRDSGNNNQAKPKRAKSVRSSRRKRST